MEKRSETEQDEKVKQAITRKREQLSLIGRIVYPIVLLAAFVLGGLVYLNVIVWPPVSRVALRTPINQIVERTPVAAPSDAPTASPISQGPVRLKLSSWRPEDNQQLQAIFEAFEAYARTKYQREIRVEHIPLLSTSYDTILSTQLERQEGPDLFYMRPFSANTDISGYTLSLNETLGPDLERIYTLEKRQPWLAAWGTYEAVPFVGVVQGIYYNKEIFEQNNLTVPTTWEAFLKAAETLKQAGYIPVANGLNAGEDSEMFMSLMINAVGGSRGRANYTNGKRCFNDYEIVSAFTSIQQILPYLPANAANLNSKSSKLLFLTGKAAMLFGGSWDVKYFEQATFEWSVFAPPAMKGHSTYVVFQPDIGMAVNQASPHREEAVLFLKWLMSEDGVRAAANNLPGFYPLVKSGARNAGNQHDTDFLRLTVEHPTDVRMLFAEISDHYPKAADIVRQALYEMAGGNLAPVDAANRLQTGLAEWYQPAQICK